MEQMKNINEIKYNVAKATEFKDCKYNNFLELACHIAIKAIVDKYHEGAITADKTVAEYNELSKWYDYYSKAYTAERTLYETQGQAMSEAFLCLSRVNIARTKEASYIAAIDILRKLFGDETIGLKYYNEEQKNV